MPTRKIDPGDGLTFDNASDKPLVVADIKVACVDMPV